MPTRRRNGQILLLLGVGGWGPRRGHPGSLFFLPQGEKSLWNRNSSCCRWGKWGLGGVSAMPEAAIKAQTANNSHSGNLLKSYILSCRHFGKEIHFPWPLILVLLFQTSAAPTTATCQPLPRGSPASLKGQWGPGNTFPLKQMIFLGAVDKPYYRDFSGDSRTLFCLLFFFITKVVQACYKQSGHGELYKEKCNSGPIFFLWVVPSAPRPLRNDLSYFPCAHCNAPCGCWLTALQFLKPDVIVPQAVHWNCLVFITASITDIFGVNIHASNTSIF